jgi:hypothetical protein
MKNSVWLKKLFAIVLICLFFFSAFNVEPAYSRGGGSGGQSITINDRTLPALSESLIILIAGMLAFANWRSMYNFIRFFARSFTEDAQLIQFTTDINSNFKNKYSMWYAKNNQIWKTIPKQFELEESQYKHLINKSELVDRVSTLFVQYQCDWTAKNFNSMKNYVVEPFYSKQKILLLNNVGNNFDIIYAANLREVIPIKVEQQEDGYIFRIQVNAEMINFTLSVDGYVLNGKPHLRSFTEYWDIGLSSENNWYLIDIHQKNI